MHQNALQMLQIVKATFPEVSFDKLSDSSRCINPKSDGLTLRCLWATATGMLDPRQTYGETEILDALTRVFPPLKDSLMQQLTHI